MSARIRTLLFILLAAGSFALTSCQPALKFLGINLETVDSLSINIIYTAIISLIFILFILLLGWLNRFLINWINRAEAENTLPDIKFQNLDLVTPGTLKSSLLIVARLLRFGLFILGCYIYSTTILHIFPGTQSVAKQVLSPATKAITTLWNGFLAYIPNLMMLVLIITVTYYINQFLKFFCNAIGQGTISISGFYREWADPTYKLSLFLTVLLAIAIGYPFLPGFDTPAFQGVTLFGAILGALGARESVSDIIAGVFLIYTRSFVVGDRIQIDNIGGIVLEKTLFVTRIKTTKNLIVSLPNSFIRNSNVINYSACIRDLGLPLMLHTVVTIGYDVPWQQVHELLIKATHNISGIDHEREPIVLQKSLGDFSIAYELNVYTNQPNKIEWFYSELHKEIQNQFNAAGIEILSPQYTAIRDGNQITIPEQYRSDEYIVPEFRISSTSTNPK